jgi:hypothetical protein
VDICNGIENLSESDIKVYPNPAAELLTVSWPAAIHEPTIRIYNMLGEIVTLPAIEQANELQIDIRQLPSQQIIICIIAEGQYVYRNITILH